VLPQSFENWLRARIELAGWNAQPTDVAVRCLAILMLTTAIGGTFTPMGLPIAFALGLVLGSLPLGILSMQASKTRNKLELQLPNALDLMVSVLRSGHAVPQSIRAVATEMPNPCGREFGEVLHRINLGQPLPEALSYTAVRYQSFELDLLRRAFHIHADVGGSLAELLDKTNSTLRGRIKLKRHVDILTAPSKLTGIIVALLPFVVGAGCYIMNPTYLDPLVKTRIGHLFICLGLILQVTGVLIMRKMSSFKV
jgi:tight adherence protein B